jgi:5-methylcytosine-specific restriction endonuclease McrA
MLWLGKVEMVKSHETVLRAATWTVDMPSVVRLKTFVRRKRTRIAMTRRNIFMRDDYQCQYCLKALPVKELTCDHVMPRSRGGKMTWENIVAACGPCNRSKGGRTPEEARMKLAKEPRRPEHLSGIYALNLGHGKPPAAWMDFLQWGKKSVA